MTVCYSRVSSHEQSSDLISQEKKLINYAQLNQFNNIVSITDLGSGLNYKKKGKLNNALGRGLFKDTILNKIINADLNAAANHIKIGFNNIKINKSLWKYCNPKKIKSNHEFDRLLKTCQIVDIQRA